MKKLQQLVARIVEEIDSMAEAVATIKVLEDSKRQYLGSNDIPAIVFNGEVQVEGEPTPTIVNCVYFDGGRFSPADFRVGVQRSGTAELRINRAGEPEARVRFRKPEQLSSGPQQASPPPLPPQQAPQVLAPPPDDSYAPAEPIDQIIPEPMHGLHITTRADISFITKVTVELLVSLHSELKEAGYNDLNPAELLEVVKGQATSIYIDYNKSR